MKPTQLLLAAVTSALIGVAQAAPVLYVHDSSGKLGTVDVASGAVSLIGNMGVVMTDIAFDPSGNLFGLSFTRLYTINPATAAASLIGVHGIPGGNALVFGTDGTLYGAGASTNSLFAINRATGASSNLGNIGFFSGGDLAFKDSKLYLATSNQLVRVDLTANASGTVVGPFGFSNVFGLATAENGILYGISGTQVFSVNTVTGAGTLVSNFGGKGLGTSYGSSFFLESRPVPVPAAVWLFGSGLLGLVGAVRRKKA